jgi:hypothetical protein
MPKLLNYEEFCEELNEVTSLKSLWEKEVSSRWIIFRANLWPP